MSHSPGSTLMPSVEITSAPAGIASVPCTPTAEMRSPSIRMTLFRTGRPPKPSISVPPTSAFTRACGWWRLPYRRGARTANQEEDGLTK